MAAVQFARTISYMGLLSHCAKRFLGIDSVELKQQVAISGDNAPIFTGRPAHRGKSREITSRYREAALMEMEGT